MRIGEIAVVGPHADDKRSFIESVASSVEVINDNITFGQFHVNSQLMIHLYGISTPTDEETVSWDLIAPNLLGYIAMFRWGQAESFRKIQRLVDDITENYNASIVVAGHTARSAPSLPPAFEYGVPIDRRGAVAFCDVNDGASVRKVLLTLVDNIIDQVQ